jgi:tetratricopeptide (TPR) repeat protein
VARRPKHKQHGFRPPDTGTLAQRAENAIHEGRFAHARELAGSLVRQTDTPAHRDLFVRATLGRANELQATGHLHDAAAVLAGIFNYLEDPAQVKLVAETLARSGDLAQAHRLAEKVNDPQLPRRLLAFAVDADMRDRWRGHVLLPAELHPHRDLLRRVFTELHAGQDDKVLESLQGIGLASPYLEWKVFVRGLLAYYQEDDARALDNWQRLSSERLPFRLAAPFRASLDPRYRKAQPAETQRALLSQLERLQGGGSASNVRALQKPLADGHHLAQAFRQVESVLPALRAEAPHLVPRLAACFFWAIIDHGFPEDAKRYQRVFGTPPEDPQLWRLEALALEHRGDLEAAHEAWGNLERSLAEHAAALPAEHVRRMRAMIWQHMGHNADIAADSPPLPSSPFDYYEGPPGPLKPSAEQCFAEALKLAPEQLAAHVAVVQHFLDHNKRGKALQAAKRLLKQFPDHVSTLTAAGDISLENGSYKDALALFQRALEVNPLDARLRARLCAAHTAQAGAQVEAGDFDRARAGFKTALSLAEADDKTAILASWAACEFKAGVPDQAEELLGQAGSAPGQALAVAYQMLVSSIRFKLGKPLKTRFEAELNRLLAEPPDVAAAVALARLAAGLARAGVKYVGQKTHEKKVVAYVDRARHGDFNEGQLLQLCAALPTLKAVRLLQNFFQTGQQRFPSNPRFYVAELDYLMSLPRHRWQPWRVQPLVAKIRELASALPAAEREALLKRVQEAEDELIAANPFARLFGNMDPMGRFGFEEDGDDDDEFDDGW